MSAPAAASPRIPAHPTPTSQADPRRGAGTPTLLHQEDRQNLMSNLGNFVRRDRGAAAWPFCGARPAAAMLAAPHAHSTIMPGTIRNHGASGKGFSSQFRALLLRALRRRLPAVAALLALSGCIPIPTGANGRWVGRLTPLAGTCEQGTDAVLLVSPKSATFSPNNGTLLLRGHADALGHVTADLRTLGMNHQPYVLSFDGNAHEGQITGTYLTPRCRASVTLARG